MSASEKRLALFLRLLGAVCCLAIIAVFMPRAWMAECHRLLGLGTFPDAPIVEYLARSLSLFYAFFGAVLWVLASDVRRWGRTVGIVACVMIGAGLVMLMIDMRSGMPWYWTGAEGPIVVILGVITIVLRTRADMEAETAAAQRPPAVQPAAPPKPAAQAPAAPPKQGGQSKP
jgi:hypothetical protein